MKLRLLIAALLHRTYRHCTYCQLYLWAPASHRTVPRCKVSTSDLCSYWEISLDDNSVVYNITQPVSQQRTQPPTESTYHPQRELVWQKTAQLGPGAHTSRFFCPVQNCMPSPLNSAERLIGQQHRHGHDTAWAIYQCWRWHDEHVWNRRPSICFI